MKLLAVILTLAVATWMFASCYRLLLTSGFWWRAAFAVLTLTGILCGMCLVAWTYDDSPTRKLTGYPFTMAAAELVDGRWRFGLLARHFNIAWAGDIGVALFIFLAPFRLVQWSEENKKCN